MHCIVIKLIIDIVLDTEYNGKLWVYSDAVHF